MAAYVSPLADLARETDAVRAAVGEIPPPPGVRLQELVLDTDSTGDPAAFIVFRASRRIPLTKTRVGALADFGELVMAAVDRLHTGRFPYIRFVE